MLVPWGAALAVGLALAPRLPEVAVTDPVRFFPENAPSREAAALLARTFPEGQAASQVVVVVESTAPLGESSAARGAIALLASRLRSALAGPGRSPTSVSGVLAPTDDPVLERRLLSKDGRAALVVVRLEAGFASEEASAVVAQVERLTASALSGTPGLSFAVSGDATLGRDYLRAIEEGALHSAVATVLLVALALLVVYRAPIAALASLVTLAVALGVASGAVVLAAELGLPVAFQSRGFLVALVWGVGTDYCLLFFARTREEWRSAGAEGALAAARLATAPVLWTSAAAVVLACALMGFAHFGLFAFSGPALAIGVAVVLAAVLTLTPTLMALAGPALLWPARVPARGDAPSDAARIWRRIARLVVARPASVLCVGLAGVAPLAWLGARITPSFELEIDVPDASPSERGMAALLRHFDPAQVSPLVLVVALPEGAPDLRGADALDGLYQLTLQLARQPGVAGVWSAAQPTGEPGLLAQATLRSQLTALRDGLGEATRGATRLAEGLDGARREVGHGRADLTSQKAAVVDERNHSLLGAFAPGRFDDAARDLDALDLKLGRLEAGLGDGVRGARALAEGVEKGRARLEALDRAPGSARLLDRLALTPEDVGSSPELSRALAHYLSQDGRAALFEILLTTTPNSPASVATADRLAASLPVLLSALGFDGARAELSGATAITRDLGALTQSDMGRLDLWIVAGVFALLVLLLRGVAAPVAITALILLSWLAAQGTLELFVRAGVWPGIDWKAPFFLFVLLVAIGADYGVFVLGRAREEERTGRVDHAAAIARALEATGPVVTSCGLVLAGTFATLLLSRIAFLEQVGVGITIGVLIDTGIVRPFLLPAAALLLDPGPGAAPGAAP